MRRLWLIRLGHCEDLTTPSSCEFRWRTVPQNSNRSNGVTHSNCASHSLRKTSTKAWRILFQRTNTVNTSAWTGFWGPGLQIASDLLCQRICSTTQRKRSFTAPTLKGIRMWCYQSEVFLKIDLMIHKAAVVILPLKMIQKSKFSNEFKINQRNSIQSHRSTFSTPAKLNVLPVFREGGWIRLFYDIEKIWVKWKVPIKNTPAWKFHGCLWMKQYDFDESMSKEWKSNCF
jgi:hypothetical protein